MISAKHYLFISVFKRKNCIRAAKHGKSHGYGTDEVLALRQALESAKNTNQRLASLNSNLRRKIEEFTRLEIRWLQEKNKLIQKNRSTQWILGRKYFYAKKEIDRLKNILRDTETNRALLKTESEWLPAASNNSLDEVEAKGKGGDLKVHCGVF